METHFEGSRGSDDASKSHQRQYDEQNPDNVNNTESDDSKLDSGVNTDFDTNADTHGSLTNDEDADTDPNQVDDKPSFNNNNR